MRRTLSALVVVLLLAATLAAPVHAQTTSIPQTYSFLATTSLMSPEMQVKVNRVGSSELVELSIPAKAGESSGMHQRLLYDFGGHRVWATDLTTNRCTVQEYGSTHAPMFDPIGSSEEMVAGMASSPPPVKGREIVNGIATKVVESLLEGGQGTYRMWLDEKRGFLVRLAIGMGKQAPTTRVEIRQLSYAPSPAALFVPPTGCTRLAGVSTAEGGHAETTIEAEASATAQLQDADKVVARADTATTPAVAEAAPSQPTKVTSVRLHVVPARHRGPCPGELELVGEVTTDGPGTVWYQFLAGAVTSSPEGTLTFKAAGTQTVKIPGAFSEAPQVREVILLAAMQDEQGRHEGEPESSGEVGLDIVCTKR